MWLLPWEKLPALVLGPLLTLVGTITLVAGHRAGNEWSDLVWDFVMLFGGIVVTVYGLVTWWRNQND